MKSFIFVFLFAAVAFAEPAWIKESRIAVKTLPRDLYIYHWTNADRAGIKLGEVVSSVDPRLFDYVKMRTGNFWTQSSQSGALGEGFYFATDPYASRSHGGEQGWALIRTVLPKGVKYFDLYFNHTWDYIFSDVALAELVQKGCTASGVKALLNTPSCWAAKRELYSALKVYLATYMWGGETVPQCRNRTQHAFFFVSDEIFTVENTIILTADTEGESVKKDQALIQKYFSYQKEHSFLWSLDSAPLATEDDFYEWVRTYVSGCGFRSEF